MCCKSKKDGFKKIPLMSVLSVGNSAVGKTAIKKNILEGNANLCEWNVTAKLMSTYKNR